VAGALLAALPIAASAQNHCSRETLGVRGTPVTISYCVAGVPQRSGSETALAVAATYSAPAGQFNRNTTMRFVEGEGPSRILENVDLAPLGITGTLHLTLTYGAGTVRIESALLTPGAIVVK
jgi:hypothetical protein